MILQEFNNYSWQYFMALLGGLALCVSGMLILLKKKSKTSDQSLFFTPQFLKECDLFFKLGQEMDKSGN